STSGSPLTASEPPLPPVRTLPPPPATSPAPPPMPPRTLLRPLWRGGRPPAGHGRRARPAEKGYRWLPAAPPPLRGSAPPSAVDPAPPPSPPTSPDTPQCFPCLPVPARAPGSAR